MTRFGFEVYDTTQFSSREVWEQHIAASFPDETASRIIEVSQLLELLTVFEAQGFHPTADLLGRIEAIAELRSSAFRQQFDEVRFQLIREIAGSKDLAEIPLIVPARRVLEFIKQHNPFFSRWLAFQSERPRRGPSDWDEYAAEGVTEEDVEYAQTMRELGQTLLQLDAQGKKLNETVAEALMHSHELEGEDRYLNTITWLYMAQEDSVL